MIKRPFPYGGGGGSIEVEITADNQVSKELDKIKGDAEGLEKSGKGAGKSFDGLLATAKKLGAVVGIATLGKKVVDFGKSCVEAYAQFEQLEGGVQQLFGKSAPQVIKNASEAYKTAGMSMNQYLESATNFSAKLISDLGGNTDLATKYIDKAMVQMSDNANTFGTTLDEVQRAYQSMARGNYAMLDSLKLGYGGTKAEMERLLADAEKLSDQKYEMGNFADLIDAIQVVQDEFNITGKTSLEAATTIEGSVNSMKSAWDNWKVAIASGENVEQTTKALLDSFGTVVDNVVPVIERIAPALGEALIGAVGEIDLGAVAVKVTDIAWDIAGGVFDAFGDILQNGIDQHILGLSPDEAKAHRFATKQTDKIVEEINKASKNLNFKEAGIQIKANWQKELDNALMNGDFEGAQKLIDEINTAFEQADKSTRFTIDAEGNINVTNTQEMRDEALKEAQSVLTDTEMETEDKVEVLTDFIIKARENGETDTDIDEALKEAFPDDLELVKQAEVIMDIETETNFEGTDTGTEVNNKIDEMVNNIDKDKEVDITMNGNVQASVETAGAQAKISSAVTGVQNFFKGLNTNLGNKIATGSIGGQVTDTASKLISNAWTKIKSAWDTIKVSLGHKTVTGSVSATITTTITNIVKTIKKAVDTGKRAITGGIVEGLQSRTTFGSNAMMQYFTALAEGFDKIADRIQKTADKVSKASTKAIEESENALETQFIKLDEIVKKEEDLEKRQADLQLRQAKSKLGTGKTAEENESLQLAYERAEIAVYKLSDEYKNLEKAQKDEQDRLEKLKREQEDYNDLVDDTTKSVDKLYDSYVKSLVNRNNMSDINLDESYNKQRNVVRAMEQLPQVLDSLRAKGMPDALIQKLLNLDPVEALKLAKKYDKMKESNFNSYVDLWSRQATAQTNLNVIDSQTNGKLEDLLEDLKEIAENSPKELSDAILHGLTWKSGDWFGMGKDAVANLTLTWQTMTTNELAKLLAPQIELEMGRKN